MEYHITHIYKYNEIVQKRFRQYKNTQNRIWNYYHTRLFHLENNPHRNKYISIEKQWYNNCLWELKYQPTIKSKYQLYKHKIERKINLYMSLILKISGGDKLCYDLILHIIQYIY